MSIRQSIFKALDVGGEMTIDELAKKLPEIDVKQIRAGIYQMNVEKLTESRRDLLNRVVFKMTEKGRERMNNPSPARAARKPADPKPAAKAAAVQNTKSLKEAPEKIGVEYHTDGTLIIWNGTAEITLEKSEALPVIRFIAGQLNYAEKLAGGTA